MEIRNIQKTGGSSYTITLPKEWVKNLKLTEKDQLEFFLQMKNQLCIRPHTKNILPTATIFVDHLSNEEVVREIISFYLSGVSEIVIHVNKVTYQLRQLVREISYKLIGFELFEETSDKLVIKNISNNTIPVLDYLTKMTKIIESMYEDMEIMLTTQDKRIAKDIIERDVEVDRIQLIIIREFNALLYTLLPNETSDLSLSERHYYKQVAIRLERIADHIVRVAGMFLQIDDKEKINLIKPEKDRISMTYKYLLQCNKMIKTSDKRMAHDILKSYDSFNKNYLIYNKLSDKTSLNIILEDCISRIRNYIANIAEETLNYYAVKNVQPLG
jgi:phosphate uptake regulator